MFNHLHHVVVTRKFRVIRAAVAVGSVRNVDVMPCSVRSVALVGEKRDGFLVRIADALFEAVSPSGNVCQPGNADWRENSPDFQPRAIREKLHRRARNQFVPRDSPEFAAE